MAILPNNFLKKYGLKTGDSVDVNFDSIKPLSKSPTAIDPEVVKLTEKLSKKYSRVWQELARR